MHGARRKHGMTDSFSVQADTDTQQHTALSHDIDDTYTQEPHNTSHCTIQAP